MYHYKPDIGADCIHALDLALHLYDNQGSKGRSIQDRAARKNRESHQLLAWNTILLLWWATGCPHAYIIICKWQNREVISVSSHGPCTLPDHEYFDSHLRDIKMRSLVIATSRTLMALPLNQQLKNEQLSLIHSHYLTWRLYGGIVFLERVPQAHKMSFATA
jgi:hypothetical protein